MDLSKIQHEKLRAFLKTYDHFLSLNSEEQVKYLEKILNMPLEKQEEVYKFLYSENEKEKIRMLKALNEKLSRLNTMLKKLKTKEEERIEENKSDSEMKGLLEEMDKI